MTGSLARYHARQPRYILNATDNNLIRYSGAERYSWEEKTELKNISLTGLTFSAPIDIKPQLGEVIKIQFEVPGSEPMACHAIVTRIEHINSYDCEIAIHFYKLERIQRINLVQGLTIKNSQIKKIELHVELNKMRQIFNIAALLTAALIWAIVLRTFFLN
ncbi:MAG: PilZ domain-containing protein [Bdellovibrionaceae bacterium]|nr:PilZ domain-containing protein [Pseudobdellovibrionaceae bacterium]